MVSRAQLVGIIAAIVLLWTGVGLAISGGVGVSDTVTIDAPDGPSVDVVTNGGELVLDGPTDDNTVEVTHDNGEVVFESTGSTQATVDTTEIVGSYTSVTGIDASNDLTVTPEDKPSVTVGGGIDSVEFGSMAVDDGTRDFSYSASSGASITVNDIGATSETVIAVAGDGTVLDQTTVDSSGTATFSSLNSGSYDVTLATTSDPALSGGTPSGGETVSETPVQLNISVSDADFPTSQGDSVNVTFYDASNGTQIGSDTLTANGTATTSWSSVVGGSNDWYAVATDSYGNSVQSQTFTFQAPATLSIRDEETQDLITGANSTVEVRFYQEGSDQVVKRTTTTGEIDLSGLPLGELVVSANVEGYENRRIVLESITEQSNIYLLNNTADSVPVEFELDDRTGEYNAEETTLFIEKSLPDGDGDNSTETYQVLAADFFGANGRYPAVLEKGARYRLRVENADGDTRALGSYTPNEPEVTPLPIGNVELTADTDGGTALQASVRDAPETATHNYEIRVVYADLENKTDSFDLSIQDGNGTQLRPNVSQTGPFGTYVETVPVENSSWDPENSTATITLTANRGTNTVQLTEQVGRVPGLFEDSRINSQILELMGIVSLVAIVGLLVIANPTIAAVVGVGYAGLLAIVGIVSIPAAAIGLAGSVAALFAAGGGDRT